ncbi:hypothetical protein C435_07010 [Haloarcula marismortui ATCC 33799]|uniref:Uncharacterized protein n=1 Tax=Haloarcula marismortui ATCC 33799 TaxID=662475 RepID=M0KG12_9EURY|nr:hypothetical protein C435_07010 [Haloarcula californiae ATCC 33799]
MLSTIFFAITVAYVLFPVSEWLGRHGLNKRLSAAVTTGIAFVSGTLIVVPLGAVLYLRRRDLFTFFQQLPPMVTLEVGEFSYPVEIAPTLIAARETLTAVAVDLAAESPVLALKAVLFSILVYAMLWRPQAPKKGRLSDSAGVVSRGRQPTPSATPGDAVRDLRSSGGDGVRDLRRGVGRVLAAGLSGRVRAGGRRRHPAVRSRHRPQRGRPYHRCRRYHQRQHHRGGTGDRIRPRLRRLPPRRGHQAETGPLHDRAPSQSLLRRVHWRRVNTWRHRLYRRAGRYRAAGRTVVAADQRATGGPAAADVMLTAPAVATTAQFVSSGRPCASHSVRLPS